MPRFPVHTIDDAPAHSRDALAQIRRKLARGQREITDAQLLAYIERV